jgi:hypothetical protein
VALYWGLTVFSFDRCPKVCSGQDGIAGIATCSVLDGTGIESSWRCDFPYCPDWAHSVSCTVGTVPFLGGKAVRELYYHPPPSSAGLWMGWSYTTTSSSCLRRRAMGWPLPLHDVLNGFVCMLLEVFGYASDIWCDSCATKVFCWWKNDYFWPVCW